MKRRLLLLVLVVVLVAGGYLGYTRYIAPPLAPANILTMTGRIEGDDAAVASKAPGRILEILVREGDTVNAGDIVARIDDEQIRAREQQAQSAVDQ
ncbi:MAG TPA: biotin/lipoyl-binding protein, partial [Bryobacteraceae bacterium]|nr:biotin/lipoyl-binding protein [Bryobacteraceae bacterium]